MTHETTAPVQSLHDQIMRLPCMPPKDANVNQMLSYKSGHRDARHAAAELAAAHEAEQAAPVAVPDGYRMVPITPTEAMVKASDFVSRRSAFDTWERMLSAAPTPPAGQREIPVAVPDEREAFEAWQRKDGWKRQEDAGEWEAWQARALLAAAPTPPAQRPVAWTAKYRGVYILDHCLPDPDDDRASLDWRPLYAAPPAQQSQQQELGSIEAMVRMLEDGEWAEHVGLLGGPIARRLESEITRMHNEQQALIAQQGAPVAVPDGWKLVPIDATDEMVNALKARIGVTHRGGILNAGNALNDAIAAAPTPPAGQRKIPAAVPDEREAFEAWQRKDGWKRPDDAGEWEAWQARAMFAAAPTPPAQQPVAEVVPELIDDGYLVPKRANLLVDLPVGAKLYAAPPAQQSQWVPRQAGKDAWRPISTAPRDGTEIILRKGDRVTSGAWIEWSNSAAEFHSSTGAYLGHFETDCGASWGSWDGGFCEDDEPSHWMPLPAAPGDAAGRQIDQLKHERDALAEAIGKAAIKVGLVAPGAQLTGPMLLMLCDDIAECCLSAESSAAAPEQAGHSPDAGKMVEGLEYEIWAAAQLAPGEGIQDGAARIAAILAEQPDSVEVPRELLERCMSTAMRAWGVGSEIENELRALLGGDV